MRVLVFWLLLALPVAAAPRGGGTFVVATGAPCTGFNPYLTSDLASWRVASLLYSSLLRYDAGLEARGDLAESWSMAPDGKSWTFRLKRGVRFHDGVELTAADVRFTIDFVRDPANRIARRSGLDELEPSEQDPARARFETIDSHALRVFTDQPSPGLIEDWASLPILPSHLLEGKDPGEFHLSRPVGTGPFRLTERMPSVVMEPFDGYHAGRARIDRLIFRVVPEDGKRLELLRQGAIDLAALPARLATDPDLAGACTVFRYLEPSYVYIGWQCDPERTRFFGDARVRRALSHAIDVDGLIRETMQGHAARVTGVVEPAGWAADRELEPPAHDPSKTAELLAHAGWFDTDGDGVVDRGGEKLSFALDAPDGSPMVRAQVARIAADLARAGIEALPRYTPWDRFMAERIQPRDFEAIYLAWYLPVEPDLLAFFHSTSIPTAANPKGLNRNGYSSREADELIEAARRSVDRGARREALVKLGRLLQQDSPYTLLFQAYQYGAVSKRAAVQWPFVPRGDGGPVELSRFGMLTPELLLGLRLIPARVID